MKHSPKGGAGRGLIRVIVGKDKKGKRTIQIGDRKASYSMITSRFMPDYPQKDTRTDFVDTDYKADTVTVVGWIKDMPDKYKGEKTFEFGYNNLFTGDQESVYADLDEQGRFKVSFPLLNSTEFFCDWSRCFMRTMLEPGKTYFLLYDFKEGRRYFMGDDCRNSVRKAGASIRGTSLALQSLQAISPGQHALAAGILLRTGSLPRRKQPIPRGCTPVCIQHLLDEARVSFDASP